MYRFCAFVFLVTEVHAAQIFEVLDAAERHPAVDVSKSTSEANRFDLEAAEWAKYPTLSIEGARPFDSVSSVTVSAEQPLYTAGRTDALIESKRASYDSEKANSEAILLGVKQDLAAKYFELLRSEMKLAKAESGVVELEKLRDIIARRVAAEVSPKVEETLVVARLQQIRAEIAQYSGTYSRARSQIKTAIGLDVVSGSLPICDVPPSTELNAMLDKAFDTSPRLSALGFDRSSARAELAVAESERYPKLFIAAEHRADLSSGGASDSTIYLGFRYQLENVLPVNSRLKSSEARLVTAEETERAAREEIGQQIVQAFQEHRIQSQQIAPLNELNSANTDLKASYLRQFEAGKKSWLDVVNAHLDQVQSEYQLVDAQVSSCLSAIQLQLLTDNQFVSY